MKAAITPTGELIVSAETLTEGYALFQWHSHALNTGCSFRGVVSSNLTVGPQPLRLDVAPVEQEEIEHD